MPARYSSEKLKKIAMGTMALDHGAAAIIYLHGLNEYPFLGELGLAMRLIGRMAFPLYAFLLVQGFLYTKIRKKYAARLGIFALISEIPFDLVAFGQVFDPGAQNTLFTILAGLLSLEAVARYQETGRAAALLAAGVWIAAAALLHADYGVMGVLFILTLYVFRDRPAERMVFGGAVLFFLSRDLYALASWIAFFFVNRYNGERGKPMGYVPYVFYPAHLLILYTAGELIYELYF